jgi:hypothetical protein
MGIGFRSLAISCALIGTLGAASVCQAAPEQDERLIYVMQFGGLTIADVMITLTETPDHYQTTVKLRSRGLLSLFHNFNADLAGDGGFADGGRQVVPASYDRNWTTDVVSSQLSVAYDPTTRLATSQEKLFNPLTGAPKSANDVPWNRHHEKRVEVPADKRTQVVDPLAAFIGVRELIRAGSGTAGFKMPIYDGLRRYDIVGTIEAPREITVNDQSRRVITVKGRVEPLVGFDDEFRDRVHDGDGKILLTADERLLPVQIMVGNTLGVGVMNLAADCRIDPAPCEAFGQEQAQAPKN